MIQKAYKFRIYPTPQQKVLLNKTFGSVRYAWNCWVENFNKAKEEPKVFKTPKQFKEELEWMREISSAAVQQKEIDFKEFKNQFFNKKRKKKLGRPSFKSRRNKQSYRLPNQKFSIDQEIYRIRLEKIGWIKVVFDRTVPQNVKFMNVTVSKDLVGDFFVSILVEQETDQLQKTGKEIGIDVGITSFAALSNEDFVDNPKFFRENQPELKKIQQHLSRKQKGSNHYNQTKKQVAKLHRKTARQRDWFLHNTSLHIVKDFDWIAIEGLNIEGMVKNHCLAKSIEDASWGTFFRYLEYKAKWHGKELHVIDRFEPTSKVCSNCGYYYKNMDLSIREWVCPICGTKQHRDTNAAKMILKVSKSGRVGPELQTWRECKTSLESCKEAVPYEVSKVL